MKCSVVAGSMSFAVDWVVFMSSVKREEPSWPDVAGLQDVLGYEFNDISLLETAVKHSSYAHERQAGDSNERLEFLGDSVLGVVIARALFDAHPAWAEGELTLSLQNLVDQRSLANLARDLEIGPFLRLGRTELQSEGVTKPGILSDAVEAILGAMYLDGGLEPVEKCLRRVFAGALDENAPRFVRDPKTRFQEWVMADTGAFPTYVCVNDSGVDGDENRFTVEVRLGDEGWGQGTARNKRMAERIAAIIALERLDASEAAEATDATEVITEEPVT
jgi:ribonuclease-3